MGVVADDHGTPSSPQRPAQGQDDARDARPPIPGGRPSRWSPTCWLPPRGRPPLGARHRHQDIAGDGGDEGQDHDRQDQPCGEHSHPVGGPGKERDEPQGLSQAGSEVIPDDGSQHEEPPQPVDDRGNRRQQLDQESDDRAHRPGGHLREEDGDPDSHRRCNEERQGRGDGGAVDERRCAKVPGHRVPHPLDEEAESEAGKRQPGAVDELQNQQGEESDDSYRERRADLANRVRAGPPIEPG